MKRVVSILALAVFAAGCSHNVATYTNGDHTAFGFTLSETGYPIFGFRRTTGENLSVAVKNNTLVNVSLANDADASGEGGGTAATLTGKTARVSGLLMYTGDQTTGNDVEMIKAIARYDVAAAKSLAEKKNATLIEGRLDENGKLVVSQVKLGELTASGQSSTLEAPNE